MPDDIRATTGYEIRVRDHLDAHWVEWFADWTLTNLEKDEVLLRKTTLDQSALHGALIKIRDLNLTLISVIQVGGDAGNSNTPSLDPAPTLELLRDAEHTTYVDLPTHP